MLEFILLVNLVFSVCGLFFIVRMWREVKSRRDYYGENFGIPFGKDKTEQQPQQQGVSMEQLAAMLSQVQQPVAVQQSPAASAQDSVSISEGDLQRMMAVISKGGGV